MGLGERDGPEGAYWEPYHVGKVLEMQGRSTDGRTYISSAEDTYANREDRVAELASQACLVKWLKPQNKFSITNEAY